MARKVTIKTANKKPLVLNTEPEPPPAPKRLVIKSAKDRQIEQKKKAIQIDEEASTFVVDDYVLQISKKKAIDVDASGTQAVDLNSSDLVEDIEQIPLEPDQVEPHPAYDPNAPVKAFKFHCYRCGQKLKVPVTWANMSIPCGRCGHELVIPPPLLDMDS